MTIDSIKAISYGSYLGTENSTINPTVERNTQKIFSTKPLDDEVSFNIKNNQQTATMPNLKRPFLSVTAKKNEIGTQTNNKYLFIGK